jgi:hypothetical protein
MRPSSHDGKILPGGQRCGWSPGHLIGGEGEIRTHEALANPPVFKTGAINRSATSPRSIQWLVFILSGRGHRSGARGGDMEAQPERARVLAVIRGLRMLRGGGSSGDAAAPLALLVHPDSGIFQFARFVIDIHLEHG